MNVLPAFDFHVFQVMFPCSCIYCFLSKKKKKEEKASYSDEETKLLALLQKQVQNAEKMCVIMSNTRKESKHIINESQQTKTQMTGRSTKSCNVHGME